MNVLPIVGGESGAMALDLMAPNHPHRVTTLAALTETDAPREEMRGFVEHEAEAWIVVEREMPSSRRSAPTAATPIYGRHWLVVSAEDG